MSRGLEQILCLADARGLPDPCPDGEKFPICPECQAIVDRRSVD